MDMKKSLLISTLVFFALFAIFYTFGQIESYKKAEKNYVLAKDDFENSKLDSALKLLEPEPPSKIAQDYYVLKYNVLLNSNNINQAEIIAKKLVKLNNKNSFNHYLLSLVYYNLGDYEKTEQCLLNSIKYEPKNNDYKINLANLYSTWGKDDKAIKLFEEVKKNDKKYETAWAGIATIYENQENYPKALIYRKDAAEKFSHNVYDIFMLAELYNKMGDKKNAIQYYEKTAKIDVNKESTAQEKYEELTGQPFHMASASTNQKIPVLFVDNLAIVDAIANGKKGKFLIDTGANKSIIYERFLRKNKISVDSDTYGLLEFANGKRQTAPACYVDFKLGTSTFYDNRIFILPDLKGITFDGILGNDVLSKTDFYIDRKNEVLIIKK